MSEIEPVLPLDDKLVCREVEPGSVFIDNDVFWNERDFMHRIGDRRPLLSAITYCEAIHKQVDRNARRQVDMRLGLYGCRVALFDQNDAVAFAVLLHEALEALKSQGLGKAQRDQARARLNRARNDLVVAATARRHDGVVVTRNRNDFALMPSRWFQPTTFPFE